MYRQTHISSKYLITNGYSKSYIDFWYKLDKIPKIKLKLPVQFEECRQASFTDNFSSASVHYVPIKIQGQWNFPHPRRSPIVSVYLLLQNNLGGTLSIKPVATLVRDDSAHTLPDTIEGVDAREAILRVSLADRLVALVECYDEA